MAVSNRVGSNWSGGSYLDAPPGATFEATVITNLMDFKGNVVTGYANPENDGTAILMVAPGRPRKRVFNAAATPSPNAFQVDVDEGLLDRVLILDTASDEILFIDDEDGVSGAVVGVIPNGSPPGVYVFGMPFSTGLKLVGNTANPSMTIAYFMY